MVKFIFITHFNTGGGRIVLLNLPRSKTQRDDLTWPPSQRASMAEPEWSFSPEGSGAFVLMSLYVIVLIAISLVLSH